MTVWPRYIFYFLGITLITWFLTRLEINFPGSLKLHVFAFENDTLGTSEYSPVAGGTHGTLQTVQVRFWVIAGQTSTGPAPPGPVSSHSASVTKAKFMSMCLRVCQSGAEGASAAGSGAGSGAAPARSAALRARCACLIASICS